MTVDFRRIVGILAFLLFLAILLPIGFLIVAEATDNNWGRFGFRIVAGLLQNSTIVFWISLFFLLCTAVAVYDQKWKPAGVFAGVAGAFLILSSGFFQGALTGNTQLPAIFPFRDFLTPAPAAGAEPVPMGGVQVIALMAILFLMSWTAYAVFRIVIGPMNPLTKVPGYIWLAFLTVLALAMLRFGPDAVAGIYYKLRHERDKDFSLLSDLGKNPTEGNLDEFKFSDLPVDWTMDIILVIIVVIALLLLFKPVQNVFVNAFSGAAKPLLTIIIVAALLGGGWLVLQNWDTMFPKRTFKVYEIGDFADQSIFDKEELTLPGGYETEPVRTFKDEHLTTTFGGPGAMVILTKAPDGNWVEAKVIGSGANARLEYGHAGSPQWWKFRNVGWAGDSLKLTLTRSSS